MRVTIRLFARLRDIVGNGELQRDAAADSTAKQVWNELAAEYPALAPYGAVSSCAVNEEYATFDVKLQDGDEVAFLPPVSGGSARLSAVRSGRPLVRGPLVRGSGFGFAVRVRGLGIRD
jgi:molybdopterin converting factor subunit 1